MDGVVSALKLIDVTLRDAHQSLWATRMTSAMMAPWLTALDRVGFHTVDLVGGAVFDVCVRYLHENPWFRMRMAAQKIRRTPLNVWIRGQSLFTFELFADDVVAATVRHIAACGIRRITTYDALNDMRNVRSSVEAAKSAGLGVTGAIVYTCSPVHTDAYYKVRTRELVALDVDRLCLKDPSGLLTPERTRTLVPAVKRAAKGVPLELHSHCLSGLAPRVYAEAMDLGVRYLHTAVSPLANGASLPAAEYVIEQARKRKFTVPVKTGALREMAGYFAWVARREDKPLGQPARYDPSMYEHQVPGGMISNLQTQLRAAGLADRLESVLQEVARVRADLGYPVMVSPFAQFLATQATLNVVQGERYKTIPDEIRKYARGYYGRAAAPMSPEFLDRAIAGTKRVTGRPGDHIAPAIPRLVKEKGPFRDYDHLLLAAYYDDALVQPVLARGDEVARSLRFVTTPLQELVDYLMRRTDIEIARLKIGDFELNAGSR